MPTARDPKLQMHNGAFSERLIAFEENLADLMTSLTESRATEHAALAATAPWSMLDDIHFEEPAVASLLAYGLPGIADLTTLALRYREQTTASGVHVAPRVLALCALGLEDAAAGLVWLAHRYPSLKEEAFERVVGAVRSTCNTSDCRRAAREGLVRVALHMRDDPVAYGRLIGGLQLFLREQMQTVTGWIRDAAERPLEPFGILLDRRWIEEDLRVVLLDASPEKPVTVAFMDMNGLKMINDTAGHAAGDEVIKTYLRTVARVVGDCGKAYRRGGDEVVITFASTPVDAAVKVIRTLLQELGRETLELEGRRVSLSSSCGLMMATVMGDPDELLNAADTAMKKRAKPAAKATSPWRSAFAIVDGPVEIV